MSGITGVGRLLAKARDISYSFERSVNMAKYLITGGDGYLAQQVITLLLSEGHEVSAIDMQFDQLNIPVKFNKLLEQKSFPLSNRTLLGKAFDGIDVCIHLAAPANKFFDSDLQAVALLDGLNVFHAAIESNNTPVIFSSTDAVYGPNIANPLFENAQMMPINSMGVHKLSLEHHARVLGLTHGLNSTSMRLFNVYGMWRNDWASDVISQFCRSALSGEDIIVQGNGDQVRDFIHVSDAARAFAMVSKNIKFGFSTYNVCTGQATSLNNLIDIMSSLLGYQLTVRYESKRRGDVYCAVGSNLKIKQDFKFMPRINIADGLRRVLKDAGAITLQKVI
jgi:nucleoside-diphosphate-sugar epimerase